ncbi:MAG: hypothetical protein J6Q05_05595 [Elusimicrobiaceae bacterium]|nr:hypothetical protein [Elusimicrobiaceae bacterium]
MHPKAAHCLAELEKSLQATARLERRLTRLAAKLPPVYWQLDPDVLRTVKQLKHTLESEKDYLLLVQKASEKN